MFPKNRLLGLLSHATSSGQDSYNFRMINRISPSKLTRKAGLTLFVSLFAVLGLFVLSGLVSYLNTRTLNLNAKAVTHTHEVLTNLSDILSLVQDAETGQRGFVITGNEVYLEPYRTALVKLGSQVQEIERLTVNSPEQAMRVPDLKSGIEIKLKELAETIDLRRTHGFDAAREVISFDRGKAAMDVIRRQIQDMEDTERKSRLQRVMEMNEAYTVAVGSGIITCLIGFLLSFLVAYLLRRAMLTRQWQEWLQSGQIGLSRVMVGDKRMEVLGDSILKYLAEYLDAHAGAFFIKEGSFYRRASTYGIPATGGAPQSFALNDGLLAQAAKDGRRVFLHDVPPDYLTVASALGKSRPRFLLIAPVSADGVVNAVLEMGFMHPIDESVIELFDRIEGTVGVAVRSANDRVQLQNFLEETQRQAEELQAQSEELRVSNEELEEQSRVLKESQTRLEYQQAELEQTNFQLAEQTQLLEMQRDEASKAKNTLELQAQELEQASQYKSDFLANMSHELRTPLNSSLILAKLLADNREGNLTAEQVEYARTIQSSGNDLLTLINDILDLSKIESGHMELRTGTVTLTQLLNDLNRTFLPIAQQKGLSLKSEILPGTPQKIETDCQRLEQVLKNILSNALKFTEKGEVSLAIKSAKDQRIAFEVSDTGIGIPVHQQQIIFEAFRQADGTTNRKYGGTGLGLSISRELARLLGGTILLTSEPGKGSTFTVSIPEVYDPALVRPRAPRQTAVDSSTSTIQPAPTLTMKLPVAQNEPPLQSKAANRTMVRRVEDDRDNLTGDSRVILVVEDDESFAKILRDMAHETNFQCLIATTAEEGLAIAVQYLPSAVVLDVGLPDHSGLSVLDRLKHDARTRHIPVHVVSAGDYAQTALSLGAVGYMIKPVKREELVDALLRLETRLSHRMRRVLVVEDDPVQLDSLQKLLGSRDVETMGAGNAAACLELLKKNTFDCMVLDLSLPDASGFSLLETLSREDAYAFPPVIVYTGRELSLEEEQQLRRYSKSIIIKGAKSPERLLDEVTLFLHQVVSELPAEQQRMLEKARSRDAAIEGRRILVVEDDVRNVFALTSILEPQGAIVQIARNGRESLEALDRSLQDPALTIHLVLMDVMMPEMDGITATREIRKKSEWKKLPIIMLTAKAMRDDQERCLAAGANDYVAKPLDVDKLLSLIRVWMPR